MSLDHAPPPTPTPTGGLLAVPIDITSVAASLVFDAAARTATATATVDFVVGPTAGNGVFDLRQTITSAALDGAPLAPAQLAHHDLGGGPGAAVRVIGTSLAAGSAHTLELAYTLGTPSSDAALPIGWDPASARVVWDLYFSDLKPGRYLEMWVPANLVHDTMALTLSVRVDHPAVAHQVFSNGTVTAVGPSAWTVVFPPHFTALSPMLLLAPTDRVVTATGSVSLPGDPTPVTIEAVRLTTESADLAAVTASLASHLTANAGELGGYAHGHRFVAWAWDNPSRSMEYDGATTSNVPSLEHETFHSWYGRGVKPARQNDGWLDEAYTMWDRDHGRPVQPFAPGDPPVTLCPRNPYSRVTPSASYAAGSRFFAGLAARFGIATVVALMRDFYTANALGLVTTEDLLAHLLARTGEPLLVGWFARYVYGSPAPTGTPDLWLRDEAGDPGAETWGGAFWDSPDLWVRRAPDGVAVHQDPVHGADNYFYARVRNRGGVTVPVFAVAFAVKEFAGTEFVYPVDHLPPLTAAVGFDLAPGASTVVSARWPAAAVPPPESHACWLAAVLAPGEPMPSGGHTWERNSLAQKNLTVIELDAGDSLLLPVRFGHEWRALERLTVEVRRPRAPGPLVSLVHKDLDVLRRIAGAEVVAEGHAAFAAGERSRLTLRLRPRIPEVLTVKVAAPPRARSGEEYDVDLVQRDEDGTVVGGVRVRVVTR